jgi:hypothetical protein
LVKSPKATESAEPVLEIFPSATRREARSHLRRGHAAERAHIVRGQLRVGHDELDRGSGRAQFLGDRLGERSADVLADFSLACEYSDDAVLPDVQPGVDVGRGLATTAAVGAGFLR